MSFWKNLRHWLKRSPPPRRRRSTDSIVNEKALDFNQELASHLRYQAEVECRSADDLAQELLAGALAQRRTNDETLGRWRSLSPREQEVTALACLGYTNQQIAARLKISAETVKTHIRNAEAKFGVSRKSDLRGALLNWDFAGWE